MVWEDNVTDGDGFGISARRLDRNFSGTLGVLCDGAQAGLLKLTAALDLLRKTNFRASP